MPKLSVIIPVYNASAFLRETLDSVLTQSLTDLELICVDDGSTDNSLDILKEYEEKDSRVRVLSRQDPLPACEHAGLSDGSLDIRKEYAEKDSRAPVPYQQEPSVGAARNLGFMHASGDYVHFLDADDKVLPYAYEAVINKAQKYDLDILRFPVLSRDVEREAFIAVPQNSISGVKSGEYDRLLTKESHNPIFRGCCCMAPWAGICRRTFLLEKNICFDNLRCVSDSTAGADCSLSRTGAADADDSFFRVGAANAGRSFFWACATNAERTMICRDRVLLHRVRPGDLAAENTVRYFDGVLRSITATAERMCADGIGEELQKAVLSVEFEEFARRYAACMCAVTASPEKAEQAGAVTGSLKKAEQAGAVTASPEQAEQIRAMAEEFAANYKGFRAWRLREKYMDAQRRFERAAKAHSVPKKVKTIAVFYEECTVPKVSVIVPVCNAEDHLNEALESLSAQDLKDMEFLLVNDGSADGSMAIMQEYAASDKRFRILDTRDCPDAECSRANDDCPDAGRSRANDDCPDAGSSHADGDSPKAGHSCADDDGSSAGNRHGRGRAINCGLGAARGKYIGILDPNDFAPANMYRDLHVIAELNDPDFILADFCRFTVNPDGTLNRKRQCIAASGEKSCYNRVLRPAEERETFGFCLNIQSGIYNREFLNRYHIRCSETPGTFCRDSSFCFQILCRAKRAYFTDTPFYMNRQGVSVPSVDGREEIRCVTEEYRFLAKLLEKEPDLAGQFGGIFYAKKFADFMTVCRGLGGEYQRECLYRIRDEFRIQPEEQSEGQPEEQSEGLPEKSLPEKSLPEKSLPGRETSVDTDRRPLRDADLRFLNEEDRLVLGEILADPDAYLDRLRVSVIMPVYNGERYLRETLESLLNSHETTFELICVDDGSTDATPEILREYEEKDDRVRVIRQENAGAGAARNAGIPLARGEYLAFLDADDIYEPDMLRRAYDRAHLTGADIVVVGSDKYIEETGEYIPTSNNIRRDLIPAGQVFAASDIRQNFFKAFVGWPWDKIFRADFVRENGLYFQKLRTTNDMLFVFAALAKAQRISVVDQVLAHHRRAEGTLSVTREKSWGCFYEALCALRDQLKSWGLYETREQDFINYCLHYCFWSLNSLRGEAYFKLYDKLKEEWLAELGVLVPAKTGEAAYTARPASFFYNAGEYGYLTALLSLSAADYLFYRKDLAAAQQDSARKKYDVLQEKMEQKTTAIREQKTLRTRDKRDMQALRSEKRRAEKENRQLTKKNDRLAERNNRLTEKNDRLREKNGRLAERNDRLREKNAQLSLETAQLKAQLDREKEERLKMKNSSIWKWGRVVTWPFRKIKRLFRKK